MLAKDVMSKDIKTLLPTATVGEALQIFKKNTCHSILIVDKYNKLRGIITTHDLILRLERTLLSEDAAQSIEEASI